MQLKKAFYINQFSNQANINLYEKSRARNL